MSDNKKILVAEDDKFLVKIYQTKLAEQGYEVVIAMDGEDALAKVESEKPDLLILDLIMPKKNGFDVLEEMKQKEELKSIPVVVLSNLGQESDVERVMQAGAVDYIIKANFSIEAVVEKIKKHTE